MSELFSLPTDAADIALKRQPTWAIFSKCRKYRYVLGRSWQGTGPVVMFVGLNPSTADETTDDPTIRRCVGFAKAWGFTGLVMLNLFAYRATDPKVMNSYCSPVGEENDAYLRGYHQGSGMTVACWGANGWMRGNRGLDVRRLLLRTEQGKLYHLGLTPRTGEPKHPLHLKKDTLPILWG